MVVEMNNAKKYYKTVFIYACSNRMFILRTRIK